MPKFKPGDIIIHKDEDWVRIIEKVIVEPGGYSYIASFVFAVDYRFDMADNTQLGFKYVEQAYYKPVCEQICLI